MKTLLGAVFALFLIACTTPSTGRLRVAATEVKPIEKIGIFIALPEVDGDGNVAKCFKDYGYFEKKYSESLKKRVNDVFTTNNITSEINTIDGAPVKALEKIALGLSNVGAVMGKQSHALIILPYTIGCSSKSGAFFDTNLFLIQNNPRKVVWESSLMLAVNLKYTNSLDTFLLATINNMIDNGFLPKREKPTQTPEGRSKVTLGGVLIPSP